MKLEKIKKTYNDYKLELSWGQVEAIAAALEANHANAVGDELYAEWKWYMERVPGPGEDEDAWEAQQKALEGGGEAGGEGGAGGEGDMPVPMPPGGQGGTAPAGGEEEATFMPDEEGGAAAPEGEPGAEGEVPGMEEPIGLQRLKGEAPPANVGGGEMGLPEPEMEEQPPEAPVPEADRRLPKPPRE